MSNVLLKNTDQKLCASCNQVHPYFTKDCVPISWESNVLVRHGYKDDDLEYVPDGFDTVDWKE